MSANGAQHKEDSILKAAQLLGEAIDLLQAAGAAIALKRSRLALAAAEVAARRAGGRKIRPAQPVAARAMPRERHELIREDGTLRFLSFMKAAGKRPAVVAISFRVSGLPSLTTTFTLDEREFAAVYEVAVKALAKHIGVIDDAALVAAMLSTSEPFLKRYGL